MIQKIPITSEIRVFFMKIVLMLSMIFLLSGCSNIVKRGAIVEAQNSLNSNNYKGAIEYIDIAESWGDPLSSAKAAKLHYLRAQALEGMGRRQEAISMYSYVIQQYSSSAYARPSRQRLNALSTGSR